MTVSEPGDREERLGECLDRLEAQLEANPQLDVSAFLAAEDPDLEPELSELAEITLSLRSDAEEHAHQQLKAPRALGQYDLGREIGRGGMGVVYLARDRRLGRQVALKVLPGFKAARRGLRERFERESQAVARLQHPHIVPLFEAGEDHGMAYLAMQYIDGQTLANPDTGAAPALEPHEAARVVRDLSRAIAYAHECGVLHRDIKSSNVMLDEGRKAWILDFGVCRLQDASGHDSTAGEGVVGTLRTMAPEQLEGRAEESSDVWGLGLVLFETLTGQRAFPQEHPSDLVRAIQGAEPPRPSALRPGLPRDLDIIARKAYARDPRERYGSAAALARDLEAFLKGAPIAARQPTALYSTKLFVRRHRIVATSAVLSVAAVTLVAAIAFGRVQEERDRAKADAYAARIAAANAAIAYGESGRALQLLGPSPPDRAGWEWAYLRARADQALYSLRPLPESRDALDVLEVNAETGEIFVGGLDGWALLEGRPKAGAAAATEVRQEGDDAGILVGTWLPGTNALVLGRSARSLQTLTLASDDGARPSLGAPTILDSTPTAVAAHRFADLGLIVLAGTRDGSLMEWRPDGTRPPQSLATSLADPVVWCGLDRDRGYLALSRAGTLVSFDPRSHQPMGRVELGEGGTAVRALEMDLSLGRGLIGDAFGNVRQVDLDTGATLLRFPSAGARRSDGARVGQHILSSSSDTERLTLHRVDDPEFKLELSGHSAPVWSVAGDAECGLFFSADREGVVAAWDPRSTAGVLELRGHENDVWALAMDADGKRLASGGRDGLVILWDLERIESSSFFGPCAGGVSDLVFDEELGRLLCAARDGYLEVCPLGETDEPRRSIEVGHAPLDGLCLDPTSKGAIAACAEGLLRLDRNLAVVQISPRLDAGPGLVRCARGAGGEPVLITTRIDRSARTGAPGSQVYGLDPTTFAIRWQRALRATPMPALDVSVSGTRLAVLDGPSTVLVLDADSGKVQESFTIPADSDARDILLRVAFGPRVELPGSGQENPANERLVATSAQGSSYLWDLESRRLVLDLDTHVGFTTALMTDGTRMVTAGSDQRVLVHHLRSSLDIHQARAERPARRSTGAGRGLEIDDKLKRVADILAGWAPEGSTTARELRAARRMLRGRLRVATRSQIAAPRVRQWIEQLDDAIQALPEPIESAPAAKNREEMEE